MPIFPAKIEAINTALIQQILQQQFPGVVVESMKVTDHAKCGDGLASTADRVSISLQYASGKDAGLPSQMILKTIFLHPRLRFGLPVIVALSSIVSTLEFLPVLGKLTRDALFSAINIYQRYFPHAPQAMYRNEVNFYRDIRPQLNLQMPQSYAAVIDENNAQFGILMEDLNLRKARFPNAVEGVSLQEMSVLIKNLADLHAEFWQSEAFDNELDWLPTTLQGGMFPVFDAIGLPVIRDQVNKNAFKRALIAPLNSDVDELWQALWQSQAMIYQQPLTLLHGDTHIGNSYILGNGEAGMLDLQLLVKGPWIHDISYLIITGLDVATRRQQERGLLNLYRQRLADNGVVNVPTEEQAWLLHRQAAIWALVIGWLITPPQNYGEQITYTNIYKAVQAMIDLQTLAAISPEAEASVEQQDIDDYHSWCRQKQ